jgi:DNA-binding CsgD family transcriptional regulator
VSAAAGSAGIWGNGLPYAHRAVRIAREKSLAATLPHALQAQASQLVGRSQFDLAYASAEEGYQLAFDLGLPWAASWALADLATVDALRGDEERARAHLAKLAPLSASSASLVRAAVARALGMLDLGLGRPSEALDHAFVSVGAARAESNPLVVLGVPDAIEAARHAQRIDEVRAYFHRYRSWVKRFPNPARLSLLARCRALIDEADTEADFAEAVDRADALPPFERARTELLFGEWLRRERRRIDARPHLRAALEAFDALGVAPWADRARAELSACGETARRRDPSTRDQLTPQELNIAGLAGRGLTNAEIGAQLFLSPRTIDYHLRKVFAKLEVASRADLTGLELGQPVTN